MTTSLGQGRLASLVESARLLHASLEPDALLSTLQHPDEAIQRQAMALLKELVLERPLKRADLLRQRLRRIEDLAEDPETVKLAAELRHIIP